MVSPEFVVSPSRSNERTFGVVSNDALGKQWNKAVTVKLYITRRQLHCDKVHRNRKLFVKRGPVTVCVEMISQKYNDIKCTYILLFHLQKVYQKKLENEEIPNFKTYLQK